MIRSKQCYDVSYQLCVCIQWHNPAVYIANDQWKGAPSPYANDATRCQSELWSHCWKLAGVRTNQSSWQVQWLVIASGSVYSWTLADCRHLLRGPISLLVMNHLIGWLGPYSISEGFYIMLWFGFKFIIRFQISALRTNEPQKLWS